MTGQKTIHISKRHLFQKISHAINTPLNGVIGCLEILNSFGETFSPDEIKGLTASSLDASKDLHKILDNLMHYHYLMDNKDFDPFPLNKSFCTSTAEIGQIIQEKTSELKRFENLDIELEPHTCLEIAKNHAQKIINELIDNACSYSLGGTKIKVRGQSDQTHYNISIRDWGLGMSPEHILSIGPFRQFNQIQIGLGLGLHIAKTLTQSYGGSLIIKSEPRQGTEIILSFPLNMR
ncbi:MAG: sensor histidine kinase [Bacteroidia bacterium]